LSRVGGKDLGQLLRRILNRLMTTQLQRSYNRLGMRGKERFKGPIEDVIIGKQLFKLILTKFIY
jgi:hypothetical protein